MLDNRDIKQTVHWLKTYITDNRSRLENEGIPLSEIHEIYKKSVKFAIPKPSFYPVLHMFGMYKKLIKNETYYFYDETLTIV